MPDDAATIRAALTRMNEAENAAQRLGLDAMIAIFDDILSEDWEGTTNDGPVHGRVEERESERAMFSAFPDYQRRFNTIIVEPPFAAFHWTFAGTHTDDFPGFPASGNRVEVSGISIVEFAGGRMRRSTLACDFTSFFAQMAKRG
ncbi:MAG: ester cyclase [Dehalococcoidia bacterium]